MSGPWRPRLPPRLRLRARLQTLDCQVEVWLADCKSPKINSLGKTTLGLTSMLFVLLKVWASVLVLLRARVTQREGTFLPARGSLPDGSLLGDRRLSASTLCL